MPTILTKVQELQKLVEQLKAIDDTLNELEIENPNDNVIDYGCRVELTYGNGVKIEGRVWGINKSGEVQVNRDGYAAYMNCNKNDLKNLSVGTIGILEKNKWIKEQKIAALKKEISEVNLSFIEFDVNPMTRETAIEIEIINSQRIQNTDFKLVSLRKMATNQIFKIVSDKLNLEIGNYRIEFYYGVITKVVKI